MKKLKEIYKLSLIGIVAILFFSIVFYGLIRENKMYDGQHEVETRFENPVNVTFESNKINFKQYQYIMDYIQKCTDSEDFDWSDVGCQDFYTEILGALRWYKEHPGDSPTYFNIKSHESRR